MTEQVLDLRGFLQIVRRHKTVVIASAGLGLVAGLGFTMLNPPLPASNALVLLPPSATRYIGTQVVIAASDPVLAGAIPRKNSAVGKLQAEVLGGATQATTGSLRIHLLITGGIGVLLGALIGSIVAVARGRSRRLLRDRDEIAAASGAPVLASIPVRHPSGDGGWTRLLEEYEPGVVHATSLGKVLHRVGLARMLSGAADDHFRYSLQVMSLASDAGALALGPQLAVYAASLGIPTAMVIGPQQEAKATASLRVACETAPDALSRRSSHLHVTVVQDGDDYRPHGALLTIVICVVNGRAPRVADMMPTTATLLAVSAGVATGEQLARVAARCAAAGRRIAGVVIADPDSSDQSTGRLPQRPGPASRAQPTRVT